LAPAVTARGSEYSRAEPSPILVRGAAGAERVWCADARCQSHCPHADIVFRACSLRYLSIAFARRCPRRPPRHADHAAPSAMRRGERGLWAAPMLLSSETIPDRASAAKQAASFGAVPTNKPSRPLVSEAWHRECSGRQLHDDLYVQASEYGGRDALCKQSLPQECVISEWWDSGEGTIHRVEEGR
jgi:hypothetical protein